MVRIIKHVVCSPGHAWALDNFFRRLLQNPKKILGQFIKPGMTVMDVGCGPGLFSVEAAKLATGSGIVAAIDLQQEMLDRISAKLAGTSLEKRMILHKVKKDSLGISEILKKTHQKKADFILAFYMVHEVPDKKRLFTELLSLLGPKGKLLVVEPKFHVSKAEFEKTVSIAKSAGFKAKAGPGVFFSRTCVLSR